MPQGMTGAEIESQQNDVNEQYECANADSESLCQKECLHRVMPQKNKKNDGKIHEITTNILKDEREAVLAATMPLAFGHGASSRVEKECPIVRLASAIPSCAKA